MRAIKAHFDPRGHPRAGPVSSARSNALLHDVRIVVTTVLRSPDRFARLIRLGPRGLASMARFLIGVVPRASRALEAIRERANAIPTPALREQALASIDGKAYHVQGGCILATFLPGAAAARYVRIVASLETIYDYLDNLCDRLPGVSQTAFATLHEALLDALDDRRTRRVLPRRTRTATTAVTCASLVGRRARRIARVAELRGRARRAGRRSPVTTRSCKRSSTVTRAEREARLQRLVCRTRASRFPDSTGGSSRPRAVRRCRSSR